MTLAAVLLPLLGAAVAGVVFACAAPIAEALLGRDARILRARRRDARRVQAAAARVELGRHRAATRPGETPC